MANIRLEAVKPRDIALLSDPKIRSGLDRELRNFIARAHADVATYPSQQPTKSGYVRSGDYGRQWIEELSDSPREVRLVNRVVSTGGLYQTKTKGVVRRRGRRRRYASYVGGPQGDQSREMARRNWRRIDAVADRHWPASRRRIIRILTGDNV